MNNLLCKAIGKIANFPPGKSFCLKDLLTEDEWASLSSSTTFGKEFKKQ
ncbi:DUF1413 domain-containing protein [Clostridium cylindrosporum]|uniref:Uncharacterized protein n=1 Tax=Clostridium cylindrosporum DSM 605 TaxID=1121307 RepID=A0A0J8DFE5_CLOCY|nr:DUF1413 domain-containing protein [Clostridium cylindrosporum]KMT22903.1 hypothetical protein CLCY_5c01420 [Clostridium cylindrosporum DSM 605]